MLCWRKRRKRWKISYLKYNNKSPKLSKISKKRKYHPQLDREVTHLEQSDLSQIKICSKLGLASAKEALWLEYTTITDIIIIFLFLSLVFLVELFIEGCERLQLCSQPGNRKDESGDSEMVGTRFLMESASGDKDNTCVLQNLKTIEQINWRVSSG